MTVYYCDLSSNNFINNTGTSATNCYTGPPGFQAAISGIGSGTALDIGDVLYIRGSGDCSRYVELDCNDTDVTTGGLGWQIGDSVRSKDGGVAEWSGVITETNEAGRLGSNDKLRVWLAASKGPSDIIPANGITNTTRSESVDPLGAFAVQGQLEFDENGGSILNPGNPLKVLGVNSDWVNDGTYAILNGDNYGCNGIFIEAKHDLWLENLVISNFGINSFHGGINHNGAPLHRLTLSNCYFQNCYQGIRDDNCLEDSVVYKCKFVNNEYCGVFRAYDLYIESCSFTGNSVGILANRFGKNIFVCDTVFHNNEDYGVFSEANIQFLNCVFNSNDVGFYATGGERANLTGCRITNNTLGIETDNLPAIFYCYFGGNTTDITGWYESVSYNGSSMIVLAGSDINHGYIDPSGNLPNLTLREDATYYDGIISIYY